MSKYVKADMIGCPCGCCETYKECQEEVDSAPSIDVVFCKDCKYWRPHSQCGYDYENGVYGDYCSLLSPEDDFYAIATKADDFCSYGERRG